MEDDKSNKSKTSESFQPKNPDERGPNKKIPKKKIHRGLALLILFLILFVAIVTRDLYLPADLSAKWDDAMPGTFAILKIGGKNPRQKQKTDSIDQDLEGAEDLVGEDLEGEEPLDNQKKTISKAEAEQMIFSSVLVQMVNCLGFSKVKIPSLVAVNIQDLMNLVGPEVGKAQLVERWREWRFNAQGGSQRKVRLETTEDDSGRSGKELHYFVKDRSGSDVPMELPPEQVANADESTVKALIGDSAVTFREVASAALYEAGERLEFIEKNGQLREIEFLKMDRVFKCQNVVDPKSCTCTD